MPAFLTLRCKGHRGVNCWYEYLREIEAIFENTSTCQQRAQMDYFKERETKLGGKYLMMTLSL